MTTAKYTSASEQLIVEVVEEGICVQCGTCVGSCPTVALEMVGENPLPALVHAQECTDCGMCLSVCPRRATDFEEISRHFFGRAPLETEVAGVVDSCWTGHLIDEQAWNRAAGGGIVSGLVMHLLESQQVDGVIMCGPEPGVPGSIVAKLVTNRDEMIANAGTHYRIVPTNALLRELANTGDQRFALVGTACHISGLRKLQMGSRKWRRKIVLTIGLLCGMNLSPLWTQHLMSDMGIGDVETVKEFRYRGWGGAGAKVVLKTGQKVELQQYFGFQLIRLAPCYMPEGCSLCMDLYAEHADVSVGDHKKGRSIAFARGAAAESALKGAVEQGWLDLEPVMPQTAQGQHVMLDLKLKRCLTLLEGRRADGLRVPDYGIRERAAGALWNHPEDKEAFLLVRRAMREPAFQEWLRQLPFWRQYRLGKLYMACEARRQWPGGSERAQTLIDNEGWQAFLDR